MNQDIIADQMMDSDYGSGPRLGRDNLAATAPAEPALTYVERFDAALRRFGHGVRQTWRSHPGAVLIAATAAGWVSARLASPQRRVR